MHKPPSDIDKILPQGEMLRGFLEQSYITKRTLSEVLRMRGIFTFGKNKSETMPILITSLISPDEFEYLREQQNTKEDNPKIITQHIEWKDKTPIIECLPNNFELNKVIDLEFSNYQVSGSPDFMSVNGDPNHVILEFKIERKDKAKNWSNNTNEFPGSLELRKLDNEDQVRMVLTYTADETKTVANEASKSVVNHFKSNGHMSAGTEVEKILFSSFNNPNRIDYLLNLTRNSTSPVLSFLGIPDLAFSPDKTSTLPKDIEWMSRKIDDLILKGESLQETFFFQEKKYHNHILLHSLESKFEFNLSGLVGTCVVALGFPEFEKSKNTDSELEVNVKSIVFNEAIKGINRNDIKKELMREIESQKIKYFSKYRLPKDVA